MHKKSLKGNLQRNKKSLKTTRFYEDEVIKLKTLKTKSMARDRFISSSNNEDENDADEDMALVVRKFKKFYRKDFNKRGKKPPFQERRTNTNHLVADCPKAIEKEKGALEAKLEEIKKKKKGKGLIGAWDQDSSESEGEEKPTCASWH
ncbi:hypothetical protein M9H77_03050 [Catharanthus roseus]|uniref:Uncharacterized protein n=1 Tax=Catharanthus roseus TaxID=4058 RepID=A0ACC0CAF4_CATRO|nr:hypothetical protein M9H77_03050 [Catharanthus roseus]